jgi:predicted Zn finger-like uncharacterized protein
MRVRCAHCTAQIEVDDAETTGRRMLQIRCWMCAQSSIIDLVPRDSGSSTIVTDPLSDEERPFAGTRLAESPANRDVSLDLPHGKSITVTVTEGGSKGLERNLTMPLATIGRMGGGADIELDDRQVSRLHCALEVKDDSVLLRDLRSTNGTYIADQRVLSAKLEMPGEFRVGGSTVRVTISPHDA